MRTRTAAILLVALLGGGVHAAAGEPQERKGGVVKENRLASARSPYLRQHRTNPVDWYPWGEEALERAKTERRPIFLSVGYAACHWCHVMEHESFEDEPTAQLLNDTFVCIKVDREERPDVDALYMRAVQVMSGRGGWPMTVLLTPEGDPFFAATYLPREGLQELTRRVADAWRTNEEGLRAQAEVVAERVRDLADGQELPEYEGTDAHLLKIVENAVTAEFDRTHGGYGGRPKFPPHTEMLYWLDRALRDGEGEELRQVLTTLEKMDEGGVHDHVGGGFHRYSTDAVWLLPHFEKMLYDNALLAQVAAGTYEATGEVRYRRLATAILDWVRREMARPEGGYASSLDADTEGEEGLTYTWTVAEMRDALPAEDAELAIALFGVTEAGNFHDEAKRQRTGRNVLHLPRPLADAAAERGVPLDAFVEKVAGIRRRLLEVRDGRAQPGLDDKVITAWNGLLLSAFARCGRAFEDEATLDDGRRLATYLLDACRRADGTLLRFPRSGGPEIVGFCEDHVHLGEGLLDLAEATGEERWAEAARDLGDRLIDEFEDLNAGGFWSTSTEHHETLFARQKETFDSPIPSENGAGTRLLLRLAEHTGNGRYRHAADRALSAWRPLLGWARAARGTVALYRALALRMAIDADSPARASGDGTASSHPVRADLFLERDRVQPGREVRFALRVTLEHGWHVNAATPLQGDLVATALTGAPTSPARVEGVTFPAAVERALTDGGSVVALHEGTFWIRGRLVVPEDARHGPRRIALDLTFQPCNQGSCLEPKEVRVEAPLRFDEAEGPARHAAVFAD